jgi:uncharacterized protein YndB with AHSA1/START domain
VKVTANGDNMNDLRLQQLPVMNTGMLIRKPVADMFEAFIDPDVTTKFWFTKSCSRLEADLQKMDMGVLLA